MNINVYVEPITVDFETACAMLGISERTLKELLANGSVNARKIGRRTVFLIEDLKAYASALPSWEPKP